MARARTYPVEAVVLQRIRMGESDLALTLLCDDGQQRRAVAKGARKPQGRLAGRVQLFSETRFLMARGRSLDVVAEATLKDPHTAVTASPDGVEAASAVCEVARHTSFEDAGDPFLYALLRRTLRAVGEALEADGPRDGLGPRTGLVVAAYTFKVTSHQGWRPATEACVECGDPSPTWFSAAAGGALCESCAHGVAGAAFGGSTGAAWVGSLVGLTFDELLRAPVDRTTSDWLLEQAHLWAATQLDARLRAFEFLLGL